MSYQEDSSPPTATQPFRWHYAELDDSNFQIRGRTLFFMAALFSVIIFIAILFLYARWVCRFAPPPPPQPPPPSTDSFSQMVNAPSRGLDAVTIDSLPIVLHKSTSVSGSAGNPREVECCICLGLFGDGDKVKVLADCNHFFHSECVDKWLATESSCPLCRASLRGDSPN